jgi:hypothetical protein
MMAPIYSYMMRLVLRDWAYKFAMFRRQDEPVWDFFGEAVGEHQVPWIEQKACQFLQLHVGRTVDESAVRLLGHISHPAEGIFVCVVVYKKSMAKRYLVLPANVQCEYFAKADILRLPMTAPARYLAQNFLWPPPRAEAPATGAVPS